MGTQRTNFLCYKERTGLVKSASTSTCCAIENPLIVSSKLNCLKILSKKVNNKQYNKHHSLEENNIFDYDEDIMRTNFQKYKLRNDYLKHYSDCNLEKISHFPEPIILFKSINHFKNIRNDLNVSYSSNEYSEQINDINNINMNINENNNNFSNKSDSENCFFAHKKISNEPNFLTSQSNFDDIQLQNEIPSEFNLLSNRKNSSNINSPLNNFETDNCTSNTSKISENENKNHKNGKDNSLNEGSKLEKENIDPQKSEKFIQTITTKQIDFQNQSCSNYKQLKNNSNNSVDFNDKHKSQNESADNYNFIILDDKNSSTNKENKTEINDENLIENNQLIYLTEKSEKVEHQEKDEKPFRRSSSLKVRNESNTTSAQKKIVRFADALGLDLTDVRTFLDELPSVPNSAFSDLKDLTSTIVQSNKSSYYPSSLDELKLLVPLFQQQNTQLNLLDRVRDNFVCLENAQFSDSPIWSISGTVRVRNLDFHKSVYVRYSLDNWCNFSEIQANYVQDSCDGFSDKFMFMIYIYNMDVNQKIDFAIRYHCCGNIYWDNNNGLNYTFLCTTTNIPTQNSYLQCMSLSKDICNSFY